MNLTNHQILAANHAVCDLLTRPDLATRARFTLVVNHKALSAAVDTMRTALPLSDDMRAFEQKRRALAMAHAARDEHGNPIGDGDSVQIAPAERDAFLAALNVLETEYRDALAAAKAAEAELLDQSLDLAVRCIDLASLPETGITNQQIGALLPLIDAGP